MKNKLFQRKINIDFFFYYRKSTHFLCFLLIILYFSAINSAVSQETGTQVPRFINPNTLGSSVTSVTVRTIRFLTTDDFPPFNFIDPQGQLEGFNVGLSRALCLEIKARCTMQALPWGDLQDALARGQGDAIIAGLAISDETIRQFAFSNPYLRFPARFFSTIKTTKALQDFQSPGDKKVGVEAGSSHEAFMKAFFPESTLVPFQNQDALRQAVQTGAVSLGFADGISTSFWLHSNAAKQCCTFVGGPYLNTDYFGPGLSIAVPIDRRDLKDALDDGMRRLMRKGKYSEIYLRYFPINFF